MKVFKTDRVQGGYISSWGAAEKMGTRLVSLAGVKEQGVVTLF